METNKKVALFIDAENIGSKYAERIIKESSNYGDTIVKRIFGDWSNSSITNWKDNISKYSLLAEQQFCFVSGKNTGDFALVISTMETLFERDIDVFCLASSDSDFTRLVQELRERGKTVIGFGEKKTNQSFVNAFSEFIYIDKQINESATVIKKNKEMNVKTEPNEPIKTIKIEKEKLSILIDIINKLIENKGKAFYAQIAIDMKNKYADFVPSNFGYSSMKRLIQAFIDSKLLVDYVIGTESDNMTMYLKQK